MPCVAPLQWRLAQRQRAEFKRQVKVLKLLLERQLELTGQDPISGARAGEEAAQAEAEPAPAKVAAGASVAALGAALSASIMADPAGVEQCGA